MRVKRVRDLGDILASAETERLMQQLADRVAEGVSDPNPDVAATLRTQVFVSKSRRSRVASKRAVGQVGIAPWLAGVEAKRGPLARALGRL